MYTGGTQGELTGVRQGASLKWQGNRKFHQQVTIMPFKNQ